MAFIALGINHKTASVDVREKVAFAPDQLPTAHRSLVDNTPAEEAVILSTCNRSEIYCAIPELAMQLMNGSGAVQVNDALLSWLAQYHNVSIDELRKSAYSFADMDAASHLAKVASGLDSLILGEPQILGQLKSAYAVATESHSTGQHLNRLFQHSFAVAKEVRTQTAIGQNAVSVAYAAVSLSTHIFADLSKCTALLIGAGETIDLVARHLRDKQVRTMIVANRTLERAESLAKEFNAQAIMLGDIPDYLHKADIVISSTASPLPILGKGIVEDALRKRKHKPMFMVDIAVPRDIEEQVSQLADVYLYTVDDLKEVIDENMKSREAAAEEALNIVSLQTKKFSEKIRSLSAVDTIREFRGQVNKIRELELEKALRKIAKGDDPEAVLRQLANGLANKFSHQPTQFLKDAVTKNRPEALDWVQQIFDLDDNN